MAKPLIAIIDYDAGNLASVANALKKAGAMVKIACDAADLKTADAIVLPGVGSFSCAKNLEPIRDALVKQIRLKPFLGICLGMQLLFEKSNEAKGSGLGILKGSVQKLKCRKVPHMGWNDIMVKKGSLLFSGIKKPAFYFCHSYAVKQCAYANACADAGGDKFIPSLEQGNLFAVQFHPEKSGSAGLRLLENFVQIAMKRKRQQAALQVRSIRAGVANKKEQREARYREEKT